MWHLVMYTIKEPSRITKIMVHTLFGDLNINSENKKNVYYE